jgi:hypothetical protein
VSRWRRKALGLGVGAGEMAVVSLDGNAAATLRAQLPLGDYLPGASDAVNSSVIPATSNWAPSVSVALAQTEISSGDLHVTVADDLARYWMVTPPAGVNSLTELRSLAESRFESLFGDNPQHWHIEADWRAQSGVFSCALPASFVSALRAGAAQHGCTLKSVQPLSIRIINRHAKDIKADAWVCSFSARGLIAVLLTGGRPTIVRQFRFAAQPMADEMITRLETEVLRAGVTMPDTVYFAGDAPAVVAMTVSSMTPRVGIEPIMLGRQLAMPMLNGSKGVAQTEACRLALNGMIA